MDNSSDEDQDFIAKLSALICIADEKKFQLFKLRKLQNIRRRNVLMLLKTSLKSKRRRKMWMKQRHGKFWELDVPKNDSNFFKESFRMSEESFEILCTKVKGIAKRHTFYRNCSPLKKRVAIALYALKSSAEYETVGRLFGVSKTMVCKILHDFCTEVWKTLAPEYMPSQFLTPEKVEECVKGFERIGFPQCLGAIDGCHIEVKPAAEDATDYHNYKGWYSTILFALVDFRYRSMYVNVGAPGRCNDSQIFEKSLLKKALHDSPILKQKAKQISGVNVPVLVLGDSAFRFSELIMKPYPFDVAAIEKEKVFNYHLSKARRVVENAFGQLKARFRRIGKGIDNDAKNVNAIIKCCCVLHNFLNERNDYINQTWTNDQNEAEVASALQQPQPIDTFSDHDGNAEEIRSAISTFLSSQTLSSENGVGVDEAARPDIEAISCDSI